MRALAVLLWVAVIVGCFLLSESYLHQTNNTDQQLNLKLVDRGYVPYYNLSGVIIGWKASNCETPLQEK